MFVCVCMCVCGVCVTENMCLCMCVCISLCVAVGWQSSIQPSIAKVLFILFLFVPKLVEKAAAKTRKVPYQILRLKGVVFFMNSGL